MKSYFLNLAISALRWYVGTGVFDRINKAVKILANKDMSGSCPGITCEVW